MYLWIENSIRGGICFVGKRYALANNPFIPGFNKHEEESYIIAVDANNLYGYAMSQPLPIGHFFWLTKDEVSAADKGCRVYWLDPRSNAVALYSGCAPRKRRARLLTDDRHTAFLVGLRGWRHARTKLYTRIYGSNAVPG
ncbi:uncharacterized protein TNCV_2306221 [Trichonephila clavipes]|nr:uncharacterized protein TNCV_2306221 [Trichonephila clavipes]